jgi:hypothetical protein
MVHPVSFEVSYKHTRSFQVTEVLVQKAKHEPDTVLSHPLVSPRLVYPKMVCFAFFVINEKFPE